MLKDRGRHTDAVSPETGQSRSFCEAGEMDRTECQTGLSLDLDTKAVPRLPSQIPLGAKWSDVGTRVWSRVPAAPSPNVPPTGQDRED